MRPTAPLPLTPDVASRAIGSRSTMEFALEAERDTSAAVETVLVVEDNPDDALLIELQIERIPRAPWRVLRAASLAEAVGILRTLSGGERPRLILLDMDLPDGRGLEALGRLNRAGGNIPVVVLTGQDDEELAVAAMRAGAQDFLVKGKVDPAVLGRSIRYALERHRLVLELEEARRREMLRATRDPLTMLPNRTLLLDRLAQAMARCQRRGELLGVAYMDLDGFKEVNDTLGHDAGDEVLITYAARLTEGVRKSDTLARLGGDEFVVLLEGLRSAESATQVAESLRERVNGPVVIQGRPCQVGLSLGVAVYPPDGSDVESLLRAADQAMYLDKASRKQARARENRSEWSSGEVG